MNSSNQQEQLYRWVKASERLPEADGYYIAVSEWKGGGASVPNDRSDTFFFNGKFDVINWEVIEWLEPYTPPVEDGKQGGEVSNDEKNFNVRIRAKIDRILRDLGVWDMLLHDSENWSDYTELRDKIYSSVGTIEPTDLLPNFKFQPFTPVQDGFTLKDIGKALCVFLTTQIAKDKCDLYETPEVFASEFIKELNQFYHTY